MLNVETLFNTYRDDVFRLAISFTRNIQEAEDVCQNVFLKLMEQKKIQPGKEKAWLMQVTANQCRSLLRSAWWKKAVPIEETLPAQCADTDGVLTAVMELQPKYRVVVFLHYYEGYTTGEIAKLLKCSQTAVTTRLSRARTTLHEKLKEV